MAIQPDAKPAPVRYMLTGGGSGGHIRPLLAVAAELKSLQPDCQVICVGDRGGNFAHLTQQHASVDQIHSIFAGKFRRYHGESWLRQLIDIRTVLLNIRDILYLVVGLLQSVFLLLRVRPAVVFLKGGFVGVPVGLAAALLRIPVVTHDSDALPGLANRIVSRWANVHATGMPAEFYPYNAAKIRHVGVLVSRDYVPVSSGLKQQYRADLQLNDAAKVLLITGGSLGSRNLNSVVRAVADKLLTRDSSLIIIHQVGHGNTDVYDGYKHERLQVLEFLDGMHRYSGASDLIVGRAGANTIAEFGVQAKACIVVPSPFLAGGHQLKNGEFLRSKQAAIVLDESKLLQNPELLQQQITRLLADDYERQLLADRLAGLAMPDAARSLAQILIKAIQKGSRGV